MDLSSAARQLGVHYQTAYRWVREGRLSATKIAGTYQVSEEEISRLLARRAEPAAPARRSTARNWPPLVERMTDLLLAGDELGARALADRLSQSGITPVELLDSLLAPALRGLGSGWADGTVSVAVEHRGTAVCERLVGRLAVHPRGRPRGVCLVATPPGERHALPASMAAVALRADRWQVQHLGADVPEDDLLVMAAELRPALVVLSTATESAAAVADQLGRRLSERGTRTLIGRPGATLAELLRRARRPGWGGGRRPEGQAVEYAPVPSTA